MKHLGIGVTVAAAAVLALSACGGTASPSGGTVKIGLSIPDGSQTYWTAYQNAAQAEAKKLGVSLTVTDARNDANTQNNDVSTLISSGVSGIVLASVDPTANASSAVAAQAASIPLVSSNRYLKATYGGADGNDPRVHVGFNDYKIGQEQGEMLTKVCASVNPCNAVLFTGTSGSAPQIGRSGGLLDTIKGQSNIKIIDTEDDNFDPTKATSLAQSVLQAHPDFQVLLTQYDDTAAAAARVIAQQHRADGIKVLSIGGSKAGIADIQSGAMYGTVWVSPEQDGAVAIDTIVSIAKKEELKGVETIDGRPTVPVGATIVTKENVADYPGQW
jgi:ABC-type sugar transport system substrate-binding protein